MTTSNGAVPYVVCVCVCVCVGVGVCVGVCVQCLSVFNYFRSIERTLTINDGGLSMEGDSAKRVR